METKSFKKYLEKRLDKDEIAEVKQQAQIEIRKLKSLKYDALILSGKILLYMPRKQKLNG